MKQTQSHTITIYEHYIYSVILKLFLIDYVAHITMYD